MKFTRTSIVSLLAIQLSFATSLAQTHLNLTLPKGYGTASYVQEQNSKSLKVFISVTAPEKTAEWAKDQCAIYYGALSFAGETLDRPTEATCDWNRNSDFLNPNLSRAQNSGKFDLFIDTFTDKENATHIRVVNWKKTQEIDFFQLGWKIEATEALPSVIGKLMNHVVQLKTNSEGVRTHALAKMSEDSKMISFDKNTKSFRDRFTFEILPLRKAEVQFMSESQKHKDYLTAAFEVASIMGAGLGLYWANEATNSRDWDYQTPSISAESLVKGTKFRFDDNAFRSTNWPHTYAAVPEYLLCRANGLSKMESFLCSFAASTVWESIIEYREVFSINDQISTTMGGIIVGESLYQLGRMFKAKRGTSNMHRIMSKIFNSPDSFNRYVQKNVTKQKQLIFDAGISEPTIWGQAEVYVQKDQVTKSNGQSSSAIWAGFEGKLISVKGWNEEGQSTGRQSDTAATDFILEGVMNNSTPGQDFHILSKIAYAAWSKKSLAKDHVGQLSGYQFFVGPSSSVETRQSSTNEKTDDFFGTINIIGTTARLELLSKGHKVTAQLEFFGDFAMVHNLSLQPYMAANGKEGLASVIQNNSYYYAVGTTSRGQIIYEKGPVTLGVSFSAHAWDSVNGRYRHQETITKDIRLSDEQQEAEGFVKYNLSKNLQLKFSAAIIKRKSNIEGQYQRETTERKVGTRLSYLF